MDFINQHSEIENKISEIRQWLASMDLQSESYEIDEFTVEYLYQLCQLNKKRDNHLEALIQDNTDKAEEFSSENERISKELESIGVTESDLSNDCTSTLTELANIGNDLNLSHPALESYLVNLSDCTMEELELKDKLQKQGSEIKMMSEKIEDLDLTYTKLRLECEDTKSVGSNVKDLPVEIEAAKAQAQHYHDSTKEFKKLLSASGIKKEFTHEHLQKMSERVSVLSSEIEATKTRIAEFKELPPSIPLAREKIRQLQIEIEAVEQQFPELACN